MLWQELRPAEQVADLLSRERVSASAASARDPRGSCCKLQAWCLATSIFDPVAPWPRKQADLPCDASDDIELLRCSGNWTQAENNPETMDALLAQEIQQGWVKVFHGTRAEAKAQWPRVLLPQFVHDFIGLIYFPAKNAARPAHGPCEPSPCWVLTRASYTSSLA